MMVGKTQKLEKNVLYPTEGKKKQIADPFASIPTVTVIKVWG